MIPKLIRVVVAVWIVVALANLPRGIVQAAPPAIDQCEAKAHLLAPAAGSTVSGVVQIEGTASLGGDFQYYKIEVAPAGTEAYGDLVGQVKEQVVNGQLGVWDSASVPDGVYTLRLRVVDVTANYCETSVTNIKVQNSQPTVAVPPTPADTPAPTEGPPIQNAVPTPLPTTPPAAGTPAATITPPHAAPSRTPEPGSGGIGGIDVSQIIDAATSFLASLGRIFLFGVIAMAGIFFFVGVVYFVRRVL